jgi:crotonobetainyl-CoA:carnitine CoA-transferase CaiB-like acyl-CoA transferase
MEPLSFLRVVDLCDLRGAMCGRMLADLGADVVLVEPSSTSPADRRTTAYRYRNANKRGRDLDLGTAAGTLALDELLADADVVIDNGGVDRRLPAELLDRHPHLVHVALRDFGCSGPRAAWVLEPLPALAAGGTLHATGFPSMAPTGVPGFLAHDCASVHGAIGAIAAVLERSRSGAGQTVEVSVQEAVLAGTTPWSLCLRDYLRVNPYLPAEGTRNADGSYWVLPAKDGWVRTVIGSQRQWDGFVQLLGRPDALIGDEWRQPGFRLMNADVVRLCAHELLADRTRAELFEQAMHGGATFGVLHTPSEFAAHEQTRMRNFFVRGFGGFGDAPFATAPYALSSTPATLRRPAPDGPGDAAFDGPAFDDAAFDDATLGEATLGDAAALRPGRWRSRGPQTSPTAPPTGDGLLLAGVRVVEFGMAAVVPELCGVLSELGAEVIKIESRTHPDVLRSASGPELNKAFTFNAESRGRASVSIDFSTPEGLELALELCRRADIVAENYRGGVLERAGLGFDAVRERNPTVIYAASQGYGRGGPYGEVPAYGPLNNGFAGLHHLWSDRAAPYPCGTSLNHPDHIAGKILAVAVLAALVHRDRTGEGQLIDMAQTEAAAYLAGELYLDAASRGDERSVCGNESATAVPHGVYPAAGHDRWLAIAVNDDASWRGFVAATGIGDDAAFATAAARVEARTSIDAQLRAWTSERDAEQAASWLQQHGVSAMPVLGPDDHHADAHLAERGFIVELHHPEVGVEHHVGNPLRLSRTPQRVAASAPCLGADTHEVLGRVLGRTPAEVDELIARGICR